LTILPTLYRFSDAGGASPLPHQRRFLHDRDAFCALTRDLATRYFAAPDVRVGTAFHSLRAVTPADVEALADALPIDADAPLHVHIAEQTREVEACVAAYGATPVDVLARTVELGPRWSLIHATHATDIELHRIARAGAAVVVCPTTEANLGDGVFPLAVFRAQRGRVAIGSDSNVTLDPAEELRWLEYAQRLAERRRHVFGAREGATLGDSLYLAALDAGAQSVGRPVGALAAGCRADFVVLAAEERDEPPSLDTRVFKSGAWRVADVVVGGEFRVRDGRHVARERLRARLARAERSQ
jgi:formimidoylglutamate deiminase